MRTKDDEKKAALFNATVKLVNEIGFAASSVSKIARQAGVSPATLYVYYKNKEDLLASTYVEIKRNLSNALLENFDDQLPIRDVLKNVWLSMFEHILDNMEYFQFTEQFANSPYVSLVDLDSVERYFEPIIMVLQKGIDQKIIKNVSLDILFAFMFYPIMGLANAEKCKEFTPTRENIEIAFTLAWDAIKL